MLIFNNFKKNKFRQTSTKGFSLVEVLVACAIISVSTFALISSAQKGILLSNQALRQTQASLLTEEGAEAVKSIRDTSWSTISALSLNTNYYLSYNNSTNVWSLGTSPTSLIDSVFTRTVVISAVNRDATDNIASAGTLDSRTKKITINISWPESNGTKTKTLSYYLADIFT